jgi:hypothetical protein
MRIAISALLLTGILAGCGSYAPEGSSPQYASAYTNGCLNGYEQGGRPSIIAEPRDNELYATDAEYRQGWEDGFKKCYDRALSIPVPEGGRGAPVVGG